MCVYGRGVYENPVRFSLNDGPMETVEYMWVNIWCMLDWIIGFCHKTVSAHVKPSLENNSSNLLISIGVIIKITVLIYTQYTQ